MYYLWTDPFPVDPGMSNYYVLCIAGSALSGSSPQHLPDSDTMDHILSSLNQGISSIREATTGPILLAWISTEGSCPNISASCRHS